MALGREREVPLLARGTYRGDVHPTVTPVLLGAALLLSGCTAAGQAGTSREAESLGPPPAAARCTDVMLNLYYEPPATAEGTFTGRVPLVARQLPLECATDATACTKAVLRAALSEDQPLGRERGAAAFDTTAGCGR